MSALDRELASIRVRARVLADRRVREMLDRIYADGAADRGVLGIPERVRPWRPRTSLEAWGAVFAAILNGLDEAARQAAHGFAAIRTQS